MGPSAARPATGAPGQTTATGAESEYYKNLLNRQNQAVANVPAIQAAQDQTSQPPNRPGPTPPGFGGQQQGQAGPEMSRYQGAYDAYMQRFGQAGQSGQQPSQGQPSAPSPAPIAGPTQTQAPMGQQPPAPPRRPGADFDRNRQQSPGAPRRPGIRMGAGYASRD